MLLQYGIKTKTPHEYPSLTESKESKPLFEHAINVEFLDDTNALWLDICTELFTLTSTSDILKH